MITWYYGNTGAGKTTAAKKHTDAVVLDSDEIRAAIRNYDLSEMGRRRQNFTLSQLALVIAEQGFDVVVASICPYRDQRESIQKMTECEFIYIGYEGDDQIPESPFER